MSNPTRIDVHQHIVSPDYANWLTENGIKPVSHFTGGLDTYPLVNQLRSAINRLNAEAMFPQFAQCQGWV